MFNFGGGGGGKFTIEEMWIAIRMNISDLKQGMAQASSDIKNYGKRLGGASEQLRTFGRTLTVISGAMATLGVLMTSTFAKFQQAMANTFSVLGATGNEMQKLTGFARELGKETIFSATQAGTAMYYLASAGYDTRQIMSSLQPILKLAGATQYDLAETTRIVVSTLNAFNLDASEASRVANTFAAAISSSQATMERLGDSMKYVAPIMANLRIPLEQTTAAMSLLYNAGLEASQAGTYVRQGMLRLQTGIAPVIEGLKRMGLSLENVSPQAHDLVEILNTLKKAGGDAIDKGDELAKIFGIRAVTAFQLLISKGGYALEQLQRKITGTGKVQSLYNIQVNTLEGTLKLLKTTITELSISFGEILSPAIRAVVGTVRDLIKVYGNLSPTIKTIITLTFTLTTVLTGLTGAVALFLSQVPRIQAALSSMSVLGGLSLGKITLLIAGVAALAGGISYLVTQSVREKRAMKENIDSISNGIDAKIKQIELDRKAADEYIGLAKNTHRATFETEAMNGILSELHEKYPSLITSTNIYSGAITDMGKVVSTTNTQLDKLYKFKLSLAKLTVNLNIQDLKKQLAEMDDNIRNSTFFEYFSGYKKETLSPEMVKTLNLSKLLKNTWDELGKSSGMLANGLGVEKGGVTYYAHLLLAALGKISLGENGVDKLTGDFSRLGDAMDSVISRETELNNKKLSNADAFTKADMMEMQGLEKKKDVLSGLISIYSKAGSKVSDYFSIKTQLNDAQELLNVMKETGEVPTPEGAAPCPEGFMRTKDGKCVPVRTDQSQYEGMRKQQEMKFNLEKTGYENELTIAKLYENKILTFKMRALSLEHKIKLSTIENERKEAILNAEELNKDTAEINKTYDDKAIAENERFNHEKQLSLKDYGDKYLNKVSNILSYELKYNQEGLLEYKKLLVDKLSSAEKWSDDYVAILQNIRAVENAINQPKENKLKYEASFDTSNIGVTSQDYTNAMKQYRDFLVEKLKATKEWSAEYVNILGDIDEVNKAIRQEEIENTKLFFVNIQQWGEITANALSSGFDQAWQQWIVGARKAKSEMDALWLAIRNAALNALGDILKSEITKALVKLFLKIFSFLGFGGVPLPGHLPVPITGSIPAPSLDYGGEVTRSGFAKIHKKEIIVPAGFVRKSRDEYSKVTGGSDNRNYAPTGTANNYYINLVNPVVDDPVYWEQAYSKHIRPGVKKVTERMTKKS